jgi:hypothetical protein
MLAALAVSYSTSVAFMWGTAQTLRKLSVLTGCSQTLAEDMAADRTTSVSTAAALTAAVATAEVHHKSCSHGGFPDSSC